MGEEPTESAATPAAPDPDAERAARKSRIVRRRVLLTIAPLTATLIVPWPDGFSWEIGERLGTAALVALPAAALAATLVAIATKRSLLARSLLLGALGLSLAWLFVDILTSRAVIGELSGDVGRWDAYVLYLVLGIPLFTFTLELFAALDRRSRPRAIFAGLGWLAFAALYVMPLRSDRLEEMPLLLMAEAVDRANWRTEPLLFVTPVVLLLLLALGAAALTGLRLVGDPERRERRRPRSGCLAIGLGALPAILALATLTLVAFTKEIEILGAAYDGGAYILGFLVGVPVALASGLDGLAATYGLAKGEGESHLVSVRARFALGALALAAGLLCLAPFAARVLPGGGDGGAADELIEIAEVIIDASVGETVPPRFVGGYSEFDLRGSSGVLRDAVGQGEEPAFAYATFEIVVLGDVNATIEVGVSPDGTLRYLSGSASVDTYPPEGTLRRASEPLADLAGRIAGGLSSSSCLPAEAPPDLPGLVDAQASIAPLCHGGGSSTRRRIQDIARGGDNYYGSGTGRYRVWARTASNVHRLEGRLYSDEGRLWIGRATLVADE